MHRLSLSLRAIPARKLAGCFQRSLSSSLKEETLVIRKLISEGRPAKAFERWKLWTREKEAPVDTYFYNTALLALVEASEKQQRRNRNARIAQSVTTFDLLNEMVERGLRPDCITVTLLMRSLTEIRDANWLLGQLDAFAIIPDTSLLNAWLRVHAECGLLKPSQWEQVAQLMTKHNLQPSLDTMHIFIESCLLCTPIISHKAQLQTTRILNFVSSYLSNSNQQHEPAVDLAFTPVPLRDDARLKCSARTFELLVRLQCRLSQRHPTQAKCQSYVPVLHRLLGRWFLWIAPPAMAWSRQVILSDRSFDIPCAHSLGQDQDIFPLGLDPCLDTQRFEALWVELNYGDGTELLQTAHNHPKILFLATEFLKHRTSTFLYSRYRACQEASMDFADSSRLGPGTSGNIRLVYGSPLELLTRLQPNSVDRVLINAPPNPFKRDLVSAPTTRAQRAKQLDYPVLLEPILSLSTLHTVCSRLVTGGTVQIRSSHKEVREWIQSKTPQLARWFQVEEASEGGSEASSFVLTKLAVPEQDSDESDSDLESELFDSDSE
eukprot:g40013.t1